MDAPGIDWRTSFVGSLAGAVRFAGRATRTELVIYGATVMMIALVVGFIGGLILQFEQLALLDDAMMLLAFVPVPALFIRRFHDCGHGGKWAWLLLPGIALWMARSGVALGFGTDARVSFDRMTWLIDWLAMLANLALLILLVLPGGVGSNRFGDDPRGRSQAGP